MIKVGDNKVLIKREPAPEVTQGGVLKIPSAARERPDYGVVIAIGSKVVNWKIGDKILFPKWSGFLITIPGDDQDYLIVFDEEVWAAI